MKKRIERGKQARGDRRRGNAMVEAALSFTIALTLVLGIIEVGLVLSTYHAMTDRAREGARYAVVNTYDEAKIKNVVCYGKADGSGTGLFGLTPGMVTVTVETVDVQTSLVRVVIQKPPYRMITPFFSKASFLPRVEVTRLVEGAGATS